MTGMAGPLPLVSGGGDGGRPTTHCSTLSSSSKSSGGGAAAGTSSWPSRVNGPFAPEFGPQACIAIPSCWDTASIPECPLSAREGYDGRPTTRDGLRPCTQDGSRRLSRTAEGRRPLSLDSRGEDGRPLQQLDGMRPSTRDGARLQQMIDGTRREGAKTRPQTKEGGHRQSSRSGASTERRGNEGSGRQLSSSRRKRHHLQAPEASAADPGATSSPSPETLSPCADADESVELLE